MNDQTTTIQDLKDQVHQFVTERHWGKHHSSANLAKSICLEAAELLEHYQWDDFSKPEDEREIAWELADIIIYCLSFARVTNIDISEAVTEKLARSAKKYPVELFNQDRDSQADFHRIKREYRRIASEKGADAVA